MCMLPLRKVVLMAALPLVACAQADSNRAPEPSRQVILYTTNEWPNSARVVDRAAELAGVRVRDALELAPRCYRVSLLCDDEAACKAAMARIAADRNFVLAVEADPRQQIPAKPSRESSR